MQVEIPHPKGGVPFCKAFLGDDRDVFSLQALVALLDVKLNSLVFLEFSVAIRLNC